MFVVITTAGQVWSACQLVHRGDAAFGQSRWVQLQTAWNRNTCRHPLVLHLNTVTHTQTGMHTNAMHSSHFTVTNLIQVTASSSTLVGIPANLSRHLQSVLNAAARSVVELRRSDNITNTLASCQWLRVPERVQFKLAIQWFMSRFTASHRRLACGDVMGIWRVSVSGWVSLQ